MQGRFDVLTVLLSSRHLSMPPSSIRNLTRTCLNPAVMKRLLMRLQWLRGRRNMERRYVCRCLKISRSRMLTSIFLF